MTHPDIEKLRAALEPFAKAAAIHHEERYASFETVVEGITAGALWYAREVFSTLEHTDEAEFGRGYEACFANFRYLLERELTARVPHVVFNTIQMVEARVAERRLAARPSSSPEREGE